MNLKLSVLDQSPLLKGNTEHDALNQTIELAKHVDQLGYERFWVSEHHSTKSLAGSAPEILVSSIAAHTKSIRVGTGGILLPHYSPYKVAETFRVLEGLYPDRIDLGIGRAPGGMPGVNYALNGGKYPDVHSYPQQTAQLLDYLQGYPHEKYQVRATPLGPTVPPVWMLGSSGNSAKLAGELGVSYTFAQFINGEAGSIALDRYYNSFIPSTQQKEPKASVAVFVVLGETDEEADYYASSLDQALLLIEQGQIRDYFPDPEEASKQTYSYFERERVQYNRQRMIIGSLNSVEDQLKEMAQTYNVDEIIVNTIVSPFERRKWTYEQLASIFN
ncbi:LLM class flavin-dependent oxidoreductase [Halalkalibacillus sediminis]|uniref:LLM class flavin-dependent oxidoreductase n=1 Tax=Halalkalibacillus sediminis TaxID=2018042 RepID=A0A2I0QRR4_9BACI|nr:LLM class flavin-dependent oxidoreductase [Halalkalibacillus sediminis]PKR77027.1 LLM class flavin-dependent oxidoreductase [Halalkalibacillus sediminis]